MANTPLQPTAVGTILSGGFRLYRDRFLTYFPIGVIASLWSLIPFLVLLAIAFLLVALGSGLSFSSIPPVLWAAIPVWLILATFATAKSITNLALISRLAYGVLADKPETLREARSHVAPKIWKFLGAYFLASLLVMAVVLVFYLILLILVGGGVIVINFRFSPLVYGVLALLGIILIAASSIFLIRFVIGLSLTQVSLAIEDHLTPWGAVKRSQQLVKGYALKIFMIFLIIWLISWPLSLLAELVFSSLITTIAARVLSTNAGSADIQILEYLISLIIGIIFSIILLPLYQTVTTTIYHYIRTQKEGM